MKLRPYVAQAVWGGRKLIETYHIPADGLENAAEAWVLSAYPGCACTIENGRFAGRNLQELAGLPPLPLIKLIDAKTDLSVQVHPSDHSSVLAPGEHGKTECWLILAAEPNARILVGLQKCTSKAAFAAAIAENRIEALARYVPVRAGDVFFISPGTLHAIGAGILLAEVQQCSNTTYRVYDYDRFENGRPRPLHVEQALVVTKRTPCNAKRTLPLSCPYFSVNSIVFQRETVVFPQISRKFAFALCLEGELTFLPQNGTPLLAKKGEGVLLPPGLSIPVHGKASALVATI
jgi:mannose-6-phosphate isomerase